NTLKGSTTTLSMKLQVHDTIPAQMQRPALLPQAKKDVVLVPFKPEFSGIIRISGTPSSSCIAGEIGFGFVKPLGALFPAVVPVACFGTAVVAGSKREGGALMVRVQSLGANAAGDPVKMPAQQLPRESGASISSIAKEAGIQSVIPSLKDGRSQRWLAGAAEIAVRAIIDGPDFDGMRFEDSSGRKCMEMPDSRMGSTSAMKGYIRQVGPFLILIGGRSVWP
ncbi:hypothetical protein ACLOJK_003680, partial [Asimina triloba]